MKKISKGRQLKDLKQDHALLRAAIVRYIDASKREIEALRAENARLTREILALQYSGENHELL